VRIKNVQLQEGGYVRLYAEKSIIETQQACDAAYKFIYDLVGTGYANTVNSESAYVNLPIAMLSAPNVKFGTVNADPLKGLIGDNVDDDLSLISSYSTADNVQISFAPLAMGGITWRLGEAHIILRAEYP
ncbi:MAG: hypothetical protein DRI24_24330, partial [Deltaproteobacteria bacterium]